MNTRRGQNRQFYSLKCHQVLSLYFYVPHSSNKINYFSLSRQTCLSQARIKTEGPLNIYNTWLIRKRCITLEVQTFAARNFRDFPEFWSNLRKLFPRKIPKMRFAKVYSREKIFSLDFLCLSSIFFKPILEMIFGRFYLLKSKQS